MYYVGLVRLHGRIRALPLRPDHADAAAAAEACHASARGTCWRLPLLLLARRSRRGHGTTFGVCGILTGLAVAVGTLASRLLQARACRRAQILFVNMPFGVAAVVVAVLAVADTPLLRRPADPTGSASFLFRVALSSLVVRARSVEADLVPRRRSRARLLRTLRCRPARSLRRGRTSVGAPHVRPEAAALAEARTASASRGSASARRFFSGLSTWCLYPYRSILQAFRALGTMC